jgi:hypothetical protein
MLLRKFFHTNAVRFIPSPDLIIAARREAEKTKSESLDTTNPGETSKSHDEATTKQSTTSPEYIGPCVSAGC